MTAQGMVFKNLANIVSILGVLPLCILFGEQGYPYLIALILFNNLTDDLDGILAAKLNIRSQFGALLDNVCDAISHPIFLMVIGRHYFQEALQGEALQSFFHAPLGVACLASSLLAVTAIIVRSVSRMHSTSTAPAGSPTNELVRHLFFILLLAKSFEFDPTPYLIITSVVHSVSMLVPFELPYLIRSLTKSATAISMVNIALLTAWLLPPIAPFIAASFFVTYLISFAVGGVHWLQRAEASA